MTKAYEIWVQDDVLDRMARKKIYKYRLQAVMWCFLNGHIINCGRFGQCLDDRVKIDEVNNDR